MKNFQWGSGRQPIQLIGVNVPFQPRLQFGHEYASASNKRASTFEQNYEVSPIGGRGEAGHGIKQPAPQREQTILSHRLSPELQRQLRGGFSTPQNNGRSHVRHFPNIEQIQVANNSNVRHRSYHITTAPTIEGKMALRAIAGVIR